MSEQQSVHSIQNKRPNRLAHETSPYLLQHAYNPVDWYPWGPEALQQARDQDKPILLSIGYAACHWCHVMAHESFEDPSIAEIMNKAFINIKVDREERPDLDEIYMRAVQALSGHGGWPMTMFLTPQLKPFFGGTYFPPTNRYNIPSFKTVLNSVAQAWSQQRQQIEQSSTQLASYLSVADLLDQSTAALSYAQITAAVERILKIFDREHGGLGSAPKFPHCYVTDFMMRVYINPDITESARHDCREFIEATLNHMAYGGIHDQLGGGFARYAVEREWFVPHFEKMLYDNASLAKNYLCGYQLFQNEYWKDVAIDCLGFVRRELWAPEGAFYSSLDADSEGAEGKFYVWTPTEIINILGKDDGQWLSTVYGVYPDGNFEHETTVLNLAAPPEMLAKQLNLKGAEFWKKLNPLRQKLLETRTTRIRPSRDEKVLTSWNALMISSFVKGYQVVGNIEYLQTAIEATRFILSNMYQDGRLLRTWSKGRAHLNGYLEDYAFMIQALLDLAGVDASPVWLTTAGQLNDFVLSHFFDQSTSNFFYTSDDHEELILRTQNNFDGPIPSSTSVVVMNLLRLSRIFDNAPFEKIAQDVMQRCAPNFERASDQYANMLCALDLYLADKTELVLVTTPSTSQEALHTSKTLPQQFKDMLKAANSIYLPNLITVVTDNSAGRDLPISLLADRTSLNNKVTAYFCRSSTCQEPATEPSRLANQLNYC